MKAKNIVGVKTTGIYCLPSCPAREPLPENIVYFRTGGQAERNGFRPCKRCFPDFPYGKWIDRGTSVFIMPPQEFNFSQCLKFLTRSSQEPCHLVEQNNLYKVIKIEDSPVLMKIQGRHKNVVSIDFLTPRPKKSVRAKAAKYVWHWFDLDTDLKSFYQMARQDPVLKKVAEEYYGLRILTIADLFEALCWAIMGQQINLAFAYTLKKRFVESLGEKFCFDKKIFYLFPTPQVISEQRVGDLKRMQFTGKKSEYIIELAGKMRNGDLTKKSLLNESDYQIARKKLLRLRGVGTWTAEYVCLRCLKDPTAFPVADVGLQNAVKLQLGFRQKPRADEILRYSTRWRNWQAYATFYLWRSLI